MVNSFLTTVYSGTNASDLAQASNTPWDAIAFGAGSDSSTSIVYGLGADSNSNLNKIYKRTLNAQIVAEGNDSTEACIETVETLLIPWIAMQNVGRTIGAGPGYAAILSVGWEPGVGYQVYINIVSGSSVSQTKLTTNTNMVIYFYPGNVWYESDTGVFFYTFSEATSEPIHIIYLGGIYVDGTHPGTPHWL